MQGVLRVACAGLAYFASARLGYAFAIPHGIVTLWPPSGVMLGLLALSDRRNWPTLLAGGLAGSFASDLLNGYPTSTALAAALANIVEALAAAWFVTWRLGCPVKLSSLRGVLVFTGGAALLTNSVTAWLGAAMLHFGFGAPLGRSWFVWWVGDGLGMLIIAPTLLAWSDGRTRLRTLKRFAVLEAAVFLVVLVAIAEVALGPRRGWPVDPGPYLVFPVLFWAAWRYGPIGAATSSLIVAAVATWNAALGVFPFAAGAASGVNAAMQLYAFLSVATLSSLIAAAVLHERTAAEEHLVQTETRYRDLFESNPHPMWVYDTGSRAFLAVNDAAIHRYGYSRAEFLSMTIADIRLPEDVAKLERSIAEVGKGRIANQVWRHRIKSGVLIDVEVSSHALEFEGRPARFVHAHDLTERRQAEENLSAAQERLQRVVASSGAVLFELRLSAEEVRMEWISDNVTRILGYTLEEVHEPDWWSGNVHPEDRKRFGTRPSREGYRDGSAEYRFRHRDGRYRWIREELRVARDASDLAVAVVVTWLDITEWRHLEDQFHQSQKLEAIGQLAGGVAHDFNNLLTVILGETELLLSGPSLGPESDREAVGEIRKAAERAAQLTRQLLTFSRRQLIAPATINVNDIVAGVDKMLRRLVGENVRMTLNLEPLLHKTVADAGQIEQVCVNLAVNARDAMSGGGSLTIETANASLDEAYAAAHQGVMAGDYVMLAVSDTGTGMSEEVKSHLFEPFFTTKDTGKGTGLGLATCYAIARQFGGHIGVYSEIGVGTTMRVYLPAVDAPASQTEARRLPARGGGIESILLVEDEEQVRRVAARALRKIGYTVHEAPNGEQAIEFLEHRPDRVDLVLTDVVLPGMGGRALAARVGELRPGMRILFMSGYSDDMVLQHRLLGLNVALLQKPFTAEALAERVRDILELPGPPG
ncbi:MAG TPA: MASE1 domain-containing protein [Gemmatimonadales bacterium]|jgi:PAS domain S-box-containing protein|nr:MASE1 domain-containing protein [Gemmatimonadales bacterium]